MNFNAASLLVSEVDRRSRYYATIALTLPIMTFDVLVEREVIAPSMFIEEQVYNLPFEQFNEIQQRLETARLRVVRVIMTRPQFN